VWASVAGSMAREERGTITKVFTPWYGTRKGGSFMTTDVWKFKRGDGREYVEQWIIIDRPNRITTIKMIPAEQVVYEFAGPTLWRIANDLRFDEAQQ
jgi:hypothetical protein